MNVPPRQRRLLLYLTLFALVAYFGLRLYAQYRPVSIYVSRQAPMPAELAEGLHMEEHRINPVVTVESPYANATDKLLTEAEVKRLRRIIAWRRDLPAFIDSLIIEGPTRVVVRRETSRTVAEYSLAKQGGRWVLEGSKKQSRSTAASE